jgi:hypothetical protein
MGATNCDQLEGCRVFHVIRVSKPASSGETHEFGEVPKHSSLRNIRLSIAVSDA